MGDPGERSLDTWPATLSTAPQHVSLCFLAHGAAMGLLGGRLAATARLARLAGAATSRAGKTFDSAVALLSSCNLASLLS